MEPDDAGAARSVRNLEELVGLYSGLAWALRQLRNRDHPAVGAKLDRVDRRLAELRAELTRRR